MYKKYIKRILDLFLSLFLLIVLSPLMILLFALVGLTSKGGIFFLHERIGKDGKIFKIIKLRTMIKNAENIGAGIYIEGKNDSRITKTGKFLRATSLDEITQLINVLKGDMSLIGPRPPGLTVPYDGYENYPGEYKARFSVRPGISGLAQISGAVSIPWISRFTYDLEYVEDVTFWNDVKIFIKTFLVAINRTDVPSDYPAAAKEPETETAKNLL